MLRLKQQMSEKSRTIQSQIITEEEAVDQVKIQLSGLEVIFLAHLQSFASNNFFH